MMAHDYEGDGIISAPLIFNHVDIKMSYLCIFCWGMSQKPHQRALIVYFMYVSYYYVRKNVYRCCV
jgi:hypothetical protein